MTLPGKVVMFLLLTYLTVLVGPSHNRQQGLSTYYQLSSPALLVPFLQRCFLGSTPKELTNLNLVSRSVWGSSDKNSHPRAYLKKNTENTRVCITNIRTETSFLSGPSWLPSILFEISLRVFECKSSAIPLYSVAVLKNIHRLSLGLFRNQQCHLQYLFCEESGDK